MTDALKNSVGDDLIYTGVWTNWSQGRWRGATITLTHRDGGLLTGFLALLVAVMGRSFWRLFCFAAHSYFSTGKAVPQDGLYHQRQAILRNADGGLGGLKYFLQLAWSWRSRSRQVWLRTLPLIGMTIFITAAFYVASVFSSQISTTTGDEVLISSPNCGTVPFNAATTLKDFFRLAPYMNEIGVSSAAYSQQCYGDSEATRRRLRGGVSCPFHAGMCRQNNTAVRVDTGIIDSQNDLGINTPPGNRFSFRHVEECSPITIDSYTSENSSTGRIQYLYGKGASYPTSIPGPITYAYPKSVATTLGSVSHNSDYVVDINYFEPRAPESSNWNPIPELWRDDASLMLFFLSANQIYFIEPVDDEWFSAHQQTGSLSRTDYNGSVKTYLTDYPANPLACTEQWQFCNPSKNKCTPLGTFDDTANSALTNLYHPGHQNDTFSFWLMQLSGNTPSVSNVVAQLGIGSLKARSTLMSGQQGQLPADQWQQEVSGWMDTSLAMMQRLAVEAATGPSDAIAREFNQKPSNMYVCKNQKVKSTLHTSFSVLGMSITFVLGALIILLELSIERVVRLIQRWRRKGLYQRLEWVSNEMLQVQRMAHEAVGAEKWIGATSSIPITGKDEELGALDISDEDHPFLVTPSPPKSYEKFSDSSDEKNDASVQEQAVGEDDGSQSTEPCDTSHAEQTSLPQQTNDLSPGESAPSPFNDQASHVALVHHPQQSTHGDLSPSADTDEGSRV